MARWGGRYKGFFYMNVWLSTVCRMEVQCLFRGKGKDGDGKVGREVQRLFLEASKFDYGM